MKKIYFAPLEGLTDHVYRRLHSKYFNGVDKYFTPFISPNSTRTFTSRELKNISPENNEGINTVPQVLTANSSDFVWAMDEIYARGYNEVNLNLGCPSGTVTAKKKGSGMLMYPELLESFLEDIFEAKSYRPINISIKTRLGRSDIAEFERILEIYNKYPIYELTVHPRVQLDYYKNPVTYDGFVYAFENSKNPVVYNGDIINIGGITSIESDFPGVNAIMLGRALLGNPSLAGEYKGTDAPDKSRFIEFYNELSEEFRKEIPSDKHCMCHLKEMWFYMLPHFTNAQMYQKKIRKAGHMSDLKIVTDSIFRNEELVDIPANY